MDRPLINHPPMLIPKESNAVFPATSFPNEPFPQVPEAPSAGPLAPSGFFLLNLNISGFPFGTPRPAFPGFRCSAPWQRGAQVRWEVGRRRRDGGPGEGAQILFGHNGFLPFPKQRVTFGGHCLFSFFRGHFFRGAIF